MSVRCAMLRLSTRNTFDRWLRSSPSHRRTLMGRRNYAPFLAALLVCACMDRPPLAPATLSAGKVPPSSPRAPESGRYLAGFDGTAAIPADVLAASGGRIIDSIPAFNILVVDDVTNPAALRA